MKRWGSLVVLLAVAALAAWWLLAPPAWLAPSPPDNVDSERDGATSAPPRLEGTGEDAAEGPAPTGERDEEDGPSVRVIGRILAEGRRPAAGAEVELRVEGELRGRTNAGEDGRFALPPGALAEGRWNSMVVRATDGAGRWATCNHGGYPGRGKDLDFGTLVLGQGYALRVLVEGEGAPLAGATVGLFGGGQRRQGQTFSTETDAAGLASFEGIPPEEFDVVAWAEGWASRARPVGLPRTTRDPVRLELERPRTVTVEIVELPGETPVEGVEVRVIDQRKSPRRTYYLTIHPPLSIAPTDEHGHTKIEGLGGESTYQLGVAARGLASYMWIHALERVRPVYRTWVPIPTDVDTVRVVLPPSRRVVWPLLPGDAPVPADGTEITFREGRQPITYHPHAVDGAHVEGRHLVVDGLIEAPFSTVAITPDGLLARLSIDASATEGEPITFMRPRMLEVVARHEDGAPAVGISVSVLDGDDKPLGGKAKTDEQGLACVEGLLSESGDVRLHPPGVSGGRVDLAGGDVQMEVTVPREEDRSIPVRLRIRLGGEKGLPSRYKFRAGWDESWVEILEEDPDEGLVHARWRPGPGKDSGVLELLSPEHVPCPHAIDLDTEELTFDLEPAGTLLFRLLHEGDFRTQGHLQFWDGVKRDWVPAERSSNDWRTLVPPLRGDAWFVRGLKPGRYRGVARPSGLISDVVEVRAGGEPAVLTLEVTSLGAIRGMVVGPEGASLKGAYVEVVRRRAGGATKEVALDEEHRFDIPWEFGSHEVVVTARHALLRAHPERGQVRLRSGQDHVRLELTYGPVASVLLEIEPEGDTPPKPPGRVRVLLLRSPRDTRPVVTLPATVQVEDGHRWRLSFGGYERGTWTLWSDIGGSAFAPLVLEGVDLDDLDPDLGTVPLTRGSRLRLKLEAGGPTGPTFAALSVKALDGPAFERMDMKVKQEAEVTGLGPGRYRVTGGWMGVDDSGMPTDLDEEIEIDGVSDYERTLQR